ncbi:MAG: amidohydrolase family protein [Candidatus Sumerlaeota bacterium]|nr:amidohydrolase family protein [Candidatus Sumerlaeota bacterium]
MHIFSDWSAADRFWGRRARWAYPFRTLLRAGLPLVFGSDSPVEPVNPFWGIYAATLRKDLQGRPPGGWYPEERLSLQESLSAYIVEPPEIVGEGGHKGRLAPGYRADFVLINRAPRSVARALERRRLTEPPEALMETHVLATAVAGEFVFSEL